MAKKEQEFVPAHEWVIGRFANRVKGLKRLNGDLNKASAFASVSADFRLLTAQLQGIIVPDKHIDEVVEKLVAIRETTSRIHGLAQVTTRLTDTIDSLTDRQKK